MSSRADMSAFPPGPVLELRSTKLKYGDTPAKPDQRLSTYAVSVCPSLSPDASSLAQSVSIQTLAKLIARKTSGLKFYLRIEPVPQRIPEKIEREHPQADRDAGVDDHPRRLLVEIGSGPGQHQSPRRRRFSHAESQERERSFRQYRLGDECRQHDEVGRHHVRHHVAEDDAQVRVARRARGVDVRQLANGQRGS